MIIINRKLSKKLLEEKRRAHRDRFSEEYVSDIDMEFRRLKIRYEALENFYVDAQEKKVGLEHFNGHNS